MHKLFALIWLTLALSFPAAAWGQTAAQRLRGEVVAVAGDTLTFKTNTGEQMSIRLAPSLRVSLESATSLASVKAGDYVGVTSAPQADGSLQAVLIRIFSEAQRGTGEGHRVMDPANSPNTMTNATVANIAPVQTMTNATVTDTASGLTLSYKGETRQVAVSEKTPVIRTELGDRSALKAGVQIVVTVGKVIDGQASTERITVGLNGITPR